MQKATPVIHLPGTSAIVDVQYIRYPNDRYQIAYYDPISKTAFEWRDIVIPKEHIPSLDSPLHLPPVINHDDKRRIQRIVQVDPIVRYAVLDEKHEEGNRWVAPGYLVHNKRFYQWAGVRIKERSLPRYSPPRRLPLVNIKKDFLDLDLIVPPLRYLVVDEKRIGQKIEPIKVAPGYFDQTNGFLFQWQGVTLKYEQLSEGGKDRVLGRGWRIRNKPIAPPKDYQAKLKADLAK